MPASKPERVESSLNGLGDLSRSFAADAPQTLVLAGRFTGTGNPSLAVSVIADRTAPAASGKSADWAVGGVKSAHRRAQPERLRRACVG